MFTRRSGAPRASYHANGALEKHAVGPPWQTCYVAAHGPDVGPVIAPTARASDEAALATAVLGKVSRRLIPFMFLLYVVAYLDRINVGFAALQMREALGFGDAVYGLGAGIFFVGYFLFEVPSNLVMHRVGARVWMARIMITWGVISMAMMLVRGPWSFYVLRFLLGAAEAGFFPGMILYLTYWFPAAELARAVARFMTATAMAGVVGGPLSGILLGLGGTAGLAGWQWLFLCEGVPAVVLGVVVLVHLTDRPEDATWLAPAERTWLAARMRHEHTRRAARREYGVLQVLAHRRVWLRGLLYFALVTGIYGIGLWLPQIIKAFGGLGDLGVGIVSTVPCLAAAAGMVVVGAHSDARDERRWHVALPAFTGAVGLVASASVTAPFGSLAALSLAALGVWSTLGPFWAMSAGFASGSAAAGAIALVNSLGNLGGFLGPYVVGLVKERTHGFGGGLVVLAAGLVVAGVLALVLDDDAERPTREDHAASALG
jgi:MFS transporter, ACS family, tartrate transporter